MCVVLGKRPSTVLSPIAPRKASGRIRRPPGDSDEEDGDGPVGDQPIPPQPFRHLTHNASTTSAPLPSIPRAHSPSSVPSPNPPATIPPARPQSRQPSSAAAGPPSSTQPAPSHALPRSAGSVPPLIRPFLSQQPQPAGHFPATQRRHLMQAGGDTPSPVQRDTSHPKLPASGRAPPMARTALLDRLQPTRQSPASSTQPSASRPALPAPGGGTSGGVGSARQPPASQQPAGGDRPPAPSTLLHERLEFQTHSLPAPRKVPNSTETLARLQGRTNKPPVSNTSEGFGAKMPIAGSSTSKFPVPFSDLGQPLFALAPFHREMDTLSALTAPARLPPARKPNPFAPKSGSGKAKKC